MFMHLNASKTAAMWKYAILKRKMQKKKNYGHPLRGSNSRPLDLFEIEVQRAIHCAKGTVYMNLTFIHLEWKTLSYRSNAICVVFEIGFITFWDCCHINIDIDISDGLFIHAIQYWLCAKAHEFFRANRVDSKWISLE